MPHTVSRPAFSHGLLKDRSKFSVLIAYENFDTGKHARKTFEYIAKQLGGEFEINEQMWRFDVLSIPKVREIAIADAAKADIIIISSHGGNLPVEVKWWLEQTLETNDCKVVALIALIDSQSEVDSTRAYLAELARENGLDFFAQPEMHEIPQGDLSVDRVHQAETTYFVLPESRQTPGYLHWGLNE